MRSNNSLLYILQSGYLKKNRNGCGSYRFEYCYPSPPIMLPLVALPAIWVCYWYFGPIPSRFPLWSSDLCRKQDADHHTYFSIMIELQYILMHMYVCALFVIPRNIQSTRDKCSHRVWKLQYYWVVRLTKLRILERSVTSMCIIV